MIPFFDYRPYYLKHQADINAAMARVLASGQLILGSEVDQFEQAFAQYTGAHHGIGVNSGTDALVLALRVMGIGPGDEVITVANTAVPTVAAIRRRCVHQPVDYDSTSLRRLGSFLWYA